MDGICTQYSVLIRYLIHTRHLYSWRGSLKSRPPPITVDDYHWPGRDRRYSDLSMDQIPLTESLLDCMERTRPTWEDKIKWELRMGRNVMVVAHANTLRGLVKLIDNIGDEEIQEVAIPTGMLLSNTIGICRIKYQM